MDLVGQYKSQMKIQQEEFEKILMASDKELAGLRKELEMKIKEN